MSLLLIVGEGQAGVWVVLRLGEDEENLDRKWQDSSDVRLNIRGSQRHNAGRNYPGKFKRLMSNVQYPVFASPVLCRNL